jgi:folylpolyglutamate synthase/dihydropteroate synthase
VAGALVLTQVGANTDWGNEQSVDPQRLREAVGNHPGLAVLVRPDAGQALDEARVLAGKNGLVCVTGSLYLVGELRQGVVPAG